MSARTAIGLDIGTSGVRAAELSFSKGEVTLERFGQIALPEGAVRDGEVSDPAAVAHALKQLWSHSKFSGKRVILGVSNSKVVVRQVEIPWLPALELKAALPYQVQDFLPMPVEQAVLDFHPLEEFENIQGARMISGLLVAAARQMVLNNIKAVTSAGLTPVQVDLTSFAVLRAVGAIDELGLSGDVEALVDVGARITNVIVHQGGVPKFVRILLMGGQDVTDAVAERMGVPGPQAEAIKQHFSLGGELSEQDGTLVRRVVESTSAAFVDEIRGSLDYFMASSGSAPIGRLVLSGGGGSLGGLADRLGAVTRLPVQLGSPLDSLNVGKTGLDSDQLAAVTPLATVPVGLALGVNR